jgi:hypothetical protein
MLCFVYCVLLNVLLLRVMCVTCLLCTYRTTATGLKPICSKIINIYILTSLLKQGAKWVWTEEKQDAFLRLRESFARSIQLAHPHEGLPYAIFTDASKLGIS